MFDIGQREMRWTDTYTYEEDKLLKAYTRLKTDQQAEYERLISPDSERLGELQKIAKEEEDRESKRRKNERGSMLIKVHEASPTL